MTRPHLLVIAPDRITHNTSDAVVAAALRIGVELTVATYLSPKVFAEAPHVRGVVPLVNADGADADQATIVARLCAAHARDPFARVVTFAEGYVEAAAAANQALGLGGNTPETAHRSRDKFVMRQALAAGGAPVPEYRLVHTYEEFVNAVAAIGRPCVSKPASASASEGVIKIDARTPLDGAWAFTTAVREIAEDGGAVLVEEYVSGQELSVEIIAQGDRAIVVGCTEKTTEEEPFFAEVMHVHPAPFDAATVAALHEVAQRTVRSLGIVEGGAHLEVRLSPRGPVVMECAARLGGDSIPIIVKLATGVDLYECVLRQASGLPFETRHTRHRVAGIRFVQAVRDGVIVEAGFDRRRLTAVRGVVGYGTLCQPGDFAARPPLGRTQRLGFALAVGDSADAVRTTLAHAEAAFDQTIVDVVADAVPDAELSPTFALAGGGL